MKILLHSCCAPCANVYTKGLDGEYKLDLLWFNHNIHPFTEYVNRRDALLQFAKIKDAHVVMRDEYGLRGFLHKTAQDFDVRCVACYSQRLKYTAKTAKEGGYDGFSTTLLSSPFQNFELICKIGKKLEEQYSLKFIEKDFRESYRAGVQDARKMNLYTQKYCGCIFSEEERYKITI